MKKLIFALLIASASSLHAANTVSVSNCTANYAIIEYTVDNDDAIVVWDGSSTATQTEFPVSATALSGRLEQDFADAWGGASNVSISAFIKSASSVSADCD